jgi:hypothetical protein
VAENVTCPTPPPPHDQTIRIRIAIPWSVLLLFSGGLMLWGLARILPDVLAYTHGHHINATVTHVVKARTHSSASIQYEATTRDHGVIRGGDRLVTPWPPAVGDRIEVAYLALGGWRHPITLWRRNWLDALFVRGVAFGVGALCFVSVCAARRAERLGAAPPPVL